MTVEELIKKLSKLPPSTVVILDDELSYAEWINIYRFSTKVERNSAGEISRVSNYSIRGDIEEVILITPYGHEDKEEL